MFDTFDIICGITIIIAIIAILIDSYRLDKTIQKQRKERNEERIKQGREPINYDAPVGSGFSRSDAESADSFRSNIFKNMGTMN